MTNNTVSQNTGKSLQRRYNYRKASTFYVGLKLWPERFASSSLMMSLAVLTLCVSALLQPMLFVLQQCILESFILMACYQDIISPLVDQEGRINCIFKTEVFNN